MTGIIYKAENKINGKVYVGQTKRPLEKRFCEHLQGKSYFCNAMRKYGREGFTIEIIDNADTRDVLNEKEKYWIMYYRSKHPNGYNLNDGGSGNNGYKATEETIRKLRLVWTGRSHTEEAKQKMREWIKTEEHKRHLRKPKPPGSGEITAQRMRGTHPTPETIQKLIDSHMGQAAWNKGMVQTEEHRQKNIDSHMGQRPWNKGMKGVQEGWNKGTHHSETTRAKMRENHKGMTGRNHTEEAKARMRATIAERKAKMDAEVTDAIR